MGLRRDLADLQEIQRGEAVPFSVDIGKYSSVAREFAQTHGIFVVSHSLADTHLVLHWPAR